MNKKRRHKTRPRRTGQRISTIKTKNNEIVNFLCQFLCNKQYDDTRPGPDGPSNGFRTDRATDFDNKKKKQRNREFSMSIPV